mgnify:CR=1 FL=1
MPILSNFVVKHIRPFGEAGYDAFGNDQTIEFLSSLGLDMDDIAGIFAAWRRAALADGGKLYRRRGELCRLLGPCRTDRALPFHA